MNIRRFDKATAKPAHNGTILGQEVLPEGMTAPFDHYYGYLETNGKMEGHSHPTDEIYIIIDGEAIVYVGDEKEKVSAGDVVEIPPNVWHTVENESGKPLLWAALWWDRVET